VIGPGPDATRHDAAVIARRHVELGGHQLPRRSIWRERPLPKIPVGKDRERVLQVEYTD
jgi:hypothetical protein